MREGYGRKAESKRPSGQPSAAAPPSKETTDMAAACILSVAGASTRKCSCDVVERPEWRGTEKPNSNRMYWETTKRKLRITHLQNSAASPMGHGQMGAPPEMMGMFGGPRARASPSMAPAMHRPPYGAPPPGQHGAPSHGQPRGDETWRRMQDMNAMCRDAANKSTRPVRATRHDGWRASGYAARSSGPTSTWHGTSTRHARHTTGAFSSHIAAVAFWW